MAKVDGAHIKEFLSTPSARRATLLICTADLGGHISIHALREEGDLLHLHRKELLHISIHALREEGDQDGKGCRVVEQISIHALREEGDTRLAATGPK